MEEKILEIILRNKNYSHDSKETAKEIVAYVEDNYYEKEFVKWKDEFTTYLPRKKQFHCILWFGVQDGKYIEFWFKTIDEVYKYWLDIKLKT